MKRHLFTTALFLALAAPLTVYAQTQTTAPALVPATPAAVAPAAAMPVPTKAELSAISVRFFGDTCLKYVASPDKLVTFLDSAFTRRDPARAAAFRQAAHATDDAIVWAAALPGGNFAVIWDPGHAACHVIGQSALDTGAVRTELNRLMNDINTTPGLQARLIATPAATGDYTENIEIAGLPGMAVGIVASVNTAAPAPNQAGSFYTLFVRHIAPPAKAPAQPAAARP